jgi:hypothetical protein
MGLAIVFLFVLINKPELTLRFENWLQFELNSLYFRNSHTGDGYRVFFIILSYHFLLTVHYPTVHLSMVHHPTIYLLTVHHPTIHLLTVNRQSIILQVPIKSFKSVKIPLYFVGILYCLKKSMGTCNIE